MAVVTVMSTVPTAPAGLAATICVPVSLRIVAGLFGPKLTLAVAEVPPAVCTVTSTVPLPGGAIAVICVVEALVIVAAAVPNRTVGVPAKLLPLMVTAVPPATGPAAGPTAVTTGAAPAP